MRRLPFIVGILFASGAAAWLCDRWQAKAAPGNRSRAKPTELSKWEGEGGGVVDAEHSPNRHIPVRRSELRAT